MSQIFGPTTLLISFETEGVGALSQEAVERIAVRDKTGRVVGLRLPQKAAVIANHQASGFQYTILTRLMPPCRADLCGLVVRMVPDILHGNTQGCVHRPEEEP